MATKSLRSWRAPWLILALGFGLACRPKAPKAEQLAPPNERSGAAGPVSAAFPHLEPSSPPAAVSAAPAPTSGTASLVQGESVEAGSSALEADSPPSSKSAFAPARSNRPHRLLVVGDSLSDPRVGGGRYLARVLTACPGSSSENLAKGGFMLNQMRRRFEAEALAKLPDSFTHLLVFGGVNDLYSDQTAGRSVAKIQRDLTFLYAAGKSKGLRVIAFTVAPWGGFSRFFSARRSETTRELNDWIRSRLAAGEVDVVVDTYPLLSCGDPERLCPQYALPFKDGLHFGPEGHARLADQLLAQAFPDCKPLAPSPPSD